MQTALSQLLIWGAGGHARVICDLVQVDRRYSIVGHLEDAMPAVSHGVPVLGGVEQLEKLRRSGVGHAIIAIGSCRARLEKARVLAGHGFELVTLVHPHAVVAADVAIGAGTVIMAGAIINSGVRIGDNVILNTGCTVDHDCVIGSGAHVCPGVHLAGGVTVGGGAWVGIGSIVIENVSIGAGATVGAGSLLLNNVPDNVLAFGRPALVVRQLS